MLKKLLIAAAAFEPDAAGTDDPGRIVELGAPPGVIDRPGGHEARFGAFSGINVVDSRGPDGAGRTRVRAIERVEQRAGRRGIDEGHGPAGTWPPSGTICGGATN